MVHVVPDLAEDDYIAPGPDGPWVSDDTHMPILSGFTLPAAATDACTRRVVGWSMATRLLTEAVRDGLELALIQRRAKSVSHRSDHG